MKRWRKQPNESGLARICQSPRGFELRENGKTLAVVEKNINGWYWYGFRQNTCRTPVATAELAKKEVMEWIKNNPNNFKENYERTIH